MISVLSHPVSLKAGLYRLYWKDKSKPSLAAVGHTAEGGNWYAPTNWISGSTTDWSHVERVELLGDRNKNMNNRIGSACWYRRQPKYGVPKTEWKWTFGTLRAWSTDHVEGDNGFGPYPVGVVEDSESVQCFSIHVEDICFASAPPTC